MQILNLNLIKYKRFKKKIKRQKMCESINGQKYKKYNNKNANDYDFFKLSFYKPNTLNEPNNFSKVFDIQNHFKLKCQFYKN